ncbi:MAG TPA: hypothetical protein VGE41_09605 [Verrucomicrobiae bacterium]|jgi:tetratricopeptide (TPR) repeat protein
MRNFWLGLGAFWMTALTLATILMPWFAGWQGNRSKSEDPLTVALGESRRLFAKHFYVKADAYFHSGYYPSIFDNAPKSEKLHMASDQHGAHGEEEAEDFLGKPHDWLDAFSRHFYPSTHRHLGEDEHGHEPQTHVSALGQGQERELLPWLKLAAELDPENPDTYMVASFWLRSKLGKVDEAEQFLRAGLRANPDHPEMLLELGRIYHENRHNSERARNLWELALKSWDRHEQAKADPNIFLLAQILAQSAKLEEEEKRYAPAAEYLKRLEAISPHKDAVHKWRIELETKAAAPRG